MNDIELFVNNLFRDSWLHSAVLPLGRQFAQGYLKDLLAFDKVDFLTTLFRLTDRGDGIALLLSVPEVWRPLRKGDWLRIALGIGPRPRTSYHDVSGRYTDVAFLIAYLSLNAISLATGPDSPLSADDKVQICRFCSGGADSLFLDEEDFDDMNGEVLCSRDELIAGRIALLAEDKRLEPDFCDAASLRAYAEARSNELAGGQFKGTGPNSTTSL